MSTIHTIRIYIFFLILSINQTNCLGLADLYTLVFTRCAAPNSEQCQPLVALIMVDNEVDLKKTASEIIHAVKNPEIKGIILVVDNAGGRADEFGTLHDMVRYAYTKKPVISFVHGAAASGGYLLICPSYIIAGEQSTIGSIGVVCELPKYTNTHLTKPLAADLEMQHISAGECKTFGDPYAPKDANEMSYFQDQVNHRYEIFTQTVANDRGIEMEESHTWANGKIFSGIQAYDLHLINQIGTFFDAEKKMMEMIRENHSYLATPITGIRMVSFTNQQAPQTAIEEQDQQNMHKTNARGYIPNLLL